VTPLPLIKVNFANCALSNSEVISNEHSSLLKTPR